MLPYIYATIYICHHIYMPPYIYATIYICYHGGAKSSRKRVKIAKISVVIASFLMNITPLYQLVDAFNVSRH